ncbi:MAG: hypothetical protein ACRDHN_09965, partial [Thermomicrobiales bacterium]
AARGRALANYGAWRMIEYDVAVIGGGPAGRLAATVLIEVGAKNIVLIDEHEIDPTLVPESPELTLLEKSTAWGLFSGFQIGVTASGSEPMFSAKRVLLATGSTEKALSFPGSDLPGVMTGRGLLRLLNEYRVWPGGRRIAVLGRSLDAEKIAMAITQSDGDLVHWVENVDVDLEAIAQDGVVSALRVDGDFYPVDVIAISCGEQPDVSLAAMIECELGYSAKLGGFAPLRTGRMETSIPGLFVCGSAAGVGFSDEVVSEARIAGFAVANSLGLFEEASFNREIEAYQAAFPNRIRAAGEMVTSWVQHDVSRSIATPVGEF